jgi:phosphopantothenoylcysteine decarboxylase/phosphopantothenate--cysteine ligase
MTEAATQFITPVTMQALSGRTVYTRQWDAREPNNMAHINLSREADAILVAPASADFIAQLAQGRADELLACCAWRGRRRCPLLLAPAMNREMWAHPATQRNVAQVVADGATLLGPAAATRPAARPATAACWKPAELCDDLIAFFQPKLLAGRNVLVTAGPTFEAIDPVRGITNLSSGKMGFAIARAAAEAGARSRWWPARCTCPRRAACAHRRASARRCWTRCCRWRPHDVFVATAAVADWRPAQSQRRAQDQEGRQRPGPTFS